MEKEFKKVSKALDTYSPQECDPAVKRKMADCRLRLEAARFEAEKVVTRLFKDHEAWGQVSREGRQRGKAADARSEPRELRETGIPAAAGQQVRFGNQLQDRGREDSPEEEEPLNSLTHTHLVVLILFYRRRFSKAWIVSVSATRAFYSCVHKRRTRLMRRQAF